MTTYRVLRASDDVIAALGQTVTYDPTTNTWVPTEPASGGASALADLTDVDLTGAATGYVLTVDGSGIWKPAPGGGGGGGGAVSSVNGQVGAVVLSASDVGAATSAQGALADTAVQPGDLATVATSGAYGDLSGTPTIPSIPGDVGAAPAVHTHTASQVSDSTATGRAVLTASTQAAARSAIGAGTSSLQLGTGPTTAAAGSHTHDDRYYTETEADGRFVRTVNGTGPDGSGNVTVAGGGANPVPVGKWSLWYSGLPPRAGKPHPTSITLWHGMPVARATALDGIAFRQHAAATGITSNVSLYAGTGAVYPGNRIADLGDPDMNTVGEKILALSRLVIDPAWGWIWLRWSISAGTAGQVLGADALYLLGCEPVVLDSPGDALAQQSRLLLSSAYVAAPPATAPGGLVAASSSTTVTYWTWRAA